MEGDGDLMKMLMQADPPDENIQAPMEDSTIVQSGVREDQIVSLYDQSFSHHASNFAHVRPTEQYNL